MGVGMDWLKNKDNLILVLGWSIWLVLMLIVVCTPQVRRWTEVGRICELERRVEALEHGMDKR